MIRPPIYSKFFLFAFLIFIGTSTCSFGRGKVHPSSATKKIINPLIRVQIIDRNGMTETISHPDRLKAFRYIDFLKPQSYQKVVRVFGRDQKGEIHAILTTYHENGTVKQYLEVINGRAHGAYREWHANGILSLSTYVANGMADLTPGAEQTWLFDGTSSAWDEEGNLLAQISYQKGNLEGPSIYYHRNGQIWKKTPFHSNVIQGNFEIYFDHGALLQTTHYEKGIKEGPSYRFWENGETAAREEFNAGLLLQGSYYNRKGEVVSEISDGCGLRSVFGRSSLTEQQEYQNGTPQGLVSTFSSQGFLISRYAVQNGMKNGEEIEYYPSKDLETAKPRISIIWKDNRIHGWVKSWYENGVQESLREMANNEKNGLLTGWYVDGSIMMIEEYEHNKLIKGEYFKRGEKELISQIFHGDGIATFYDSEGNFLEKIEYFQGKPCEN